MLKLHYLTIGIVLITLLSFKTASAGDRTEKNVIGNNFDLSPLPEAKPLLERLASVLDDVRLLESLKQSKTLQSLHERMKINLFHLNLIFDVQAKNYPYDPVFEQPFPFRPTVEAINDAIHFFEILESTTGYRNPILNQLKEVPYFAQLQDYLANSRNDLAGLNWSRFNVNLGLERGHKWEERILKQKRLFNIFELLS